MKVFTNTENGDWNEAGALQWADGALEVETDNDAIRRIVERVNETDTWDTAAPPEGSNAPVAERSEPIDEERALSLVRTYLLGNGFGLAEESELGDS